MPSMPNKNILVVDRPEIRLLLRWILEKRGFQVLDADVYQAFDLLREQTRTIDLLITNTPRQLIHLRPGLRLLYISGAPDPEFVRSAPSKGFAVLHKPFGEERLIKQIHRLLSSKQSLGSQIVTSPVVKKT